MKLANEAFQRQTRKLREEGRLPPHVPRWFIMSSDPDSGTRVWEPKRADNGEVLYWHIREEAPRKQWADIDGIFVESEGVDERHGN